jgi:hypothetical protein
LLVVVAEAARFPLELMVVLEVVQGDFVLLLLQLAAEVL